MSGPKIDSSAQVDVKGTLGRDVTIGPFCTVGPDVALGDGCVLVAHVHVSGHTAIGARTIVRPFASLGSPPQSVHYRGGATRLAVGADCDIRENVTMNTGTEDGGGITEVGDKCFLMVGAHVGHDCKVGSNVVVANNVLLAGHVTVGDHVVFGGGAAVRQFVRIGEGAMLVGLSGIRADVIPWGMAQGPLANLVGLNVVGMRRRGLAKAGIQHYREAYRELFLGAGEFRARLDQVAAACAGDAVVQKLIDFIRAGKRPLTMAGKRGEAGESEALA